MSALKSTKHFAESVYTQGDVSPCCTHMFLQFHLIRPRWFYDGTEQECFSFCSLVNFETVMSFLSVLMGTVNMKVFRDGPGITLEFEAGVISNV